MDSYNILVCNVCGLNGRDRCDVVSSLVGVECPSVVCIQETKLDVISDIDIMQILGLGFDYTYLPAVHTRGAYIGRLACCELVGFQLLVKAIIGLIQNVPLFVHRRVVVDVDFRTIQ
jgi:hypothetical protein